MIRAGNRRAPLRIVHIAWNDEQPKAAKCIWLKIVKLAARPAAVAAGIARGDSAPPSALR
jgi:hypothetical protein